MRYGQQTCRRTVAARLIAGVERETGFEPATPCLEGRHSTAELLPLVIQDTHAPMARQRSVRPKAGT